MFDFIWNQFINYPFTNALLYLYALIGNNFVLAITIFTVIIRLITVPFTLSSQKSQQRMQELQPRIKEVQEKYRHEPEKLNAEMAALGVNPLSMVGGCLPMILQFPILIGLYQAINHVMAVTPLALVDLYHAIYPFFPNFDKLIPVNSRFLWLNLAQPDPFFVLPALVFATTWLSQKLISPPAQAGTDPQQAQMTQQMGIMMSVMFGFMSLQFASGLSIYFIISNLVSMVQYPLSNPKQRQRLLAYLRGEKQPEPEPKTVKGSKPSGKPAKAGAKKRDSQRKEITNE
jgi:YidC/Oxa1 family membrane protein insertase